MSSVGMTATVAQACPVAGSCGGRLPYLLSLPALLVCIGILIPFFTAVYYSMLRFRLNLPMLKGFIWFDNYTAFCRRSRLSGTRSSSRLPMLGSRSASS